MWKRLMKTYRVNGSHIKRLRERLGSGATQKELAFAVGISERQLRNIENSNPIIKRNVLERLACHLSVEVKDIAYAIDGPRLVPSGSVANVATTLLPVGDYLRPRYDIEYASATMDADELFKHASSSHTVVCTIETKLTSERSSYVNEIMELLAGVSYSRSSVLDEISEDAERAIKRRIRELLVLLKGNDIWVYETWVLRRVPECDDLPAEGANSKMEFQTLLAFGPPGEYGETSLKVMVDYGQPEIIKGLRSVVGPTQSD
jgi:transcriptional regulator with XRE-family HTH domain